MQTFILTLICKLLEELAAGLKSAFVFVCVRITHTLVFHFVCYIFYTIYQSGADGEHT